MLNSINLIGNICKDLELKTTESGKSVCSFDIAVKRPFAKDVTDFIKVVCWNNQAENVCKYCHKGMRVGVSGMMTSRTYQDKDKNNRTVYEVVANNVVFLEKKDEGQSNDAEGFASGMALDGFVPIPSDDDLPF